MTAFHEPTEAQSSELFRALALLTSKLESIEQRFGVAVDPELFPEFADAADLALRAFACTINPAKGDTVKLTGELQAHLGKLDPATVSRAAAAHGLSASA